MWKRHTNEPQERAGRMAVSWSEEDLNGHSVYRKRVIEAVKQYAERMPYAMRRHVSCLA